MNDADREILNHFIQTHEKTLELSGRIPAKWFSKTADGEDMTMGWLFMHIANGPDWWMNHCMQDGKGWAYQGHGPFDKDTVHAALTISMNRLVSFFETDDGKRMGLFFELIPEKKEGDGRWSGRNRILYLADHEIHHRGRIELALRQWGMTDLPFMP